MSTRLIPAGRYYIGDPCYVVENSDWSAFLTALQDGMPWRAFNPLAFRTFGDGLFRDNQDREYSVDSGMIGIIPVQLMDATGNESGGQVLDFPHPFRCREHPQKNAISFGPVTIKVGP